MAFKRPAAAVPAKETKKPRVSSKKLNFDSVVNALDEADFLERSVVNMLKEIVPGVLGEYKDERHQFLNEGVEMIGETLAGIDAAISTAIEGHQAAVDGADAEKARREASLAAAEAVLSERSADTKARKETLVEKAAAAKSAQEALNAAENAERTGNADLDAVGERKAAIEAIIATVAEFKEAPAVKKKVASLVKALKPFSICESLVNTMAVPLMKKPEERVGFDLLVFENLEKSCADKLSEFEATIASGAPAKAARAADVAGAQAAREAAEEQKKASADALKSAQVAEKEAEAALAAAHKDVKSHGPEMVKAQGALDSAKDRQTAFREGPLARFAELRDRSTPAPEPEVVVEVAAEAAEGDEEAAAEADEAAQAVEAEAGSAN